MRIIEEFGKTVEEAREKAFKALGIQSDDEKGVEVEVLDEGSPGNSSGWGRKFARIKVTLRRTDGSEPVEDEAEAEVEEDDADLAEDTRETLEEILDLMRLQVNVEEEESDETGPLLNIVGPDQGILIGKHGQTLDALQFVLNLIANKEARVRRRIQLDAGGYRQRRAKSLKDLALRVARRAMDEGRDIALEPMTPGERRIIHMALADDPDVETFSDGVEPMRKVIIAPRH